VCEPGRDRRRHWEPSSARKRLRGTAAKAGVRRRFAPHQLRHAHAVEMADGGVPLVVIQRQLGPANLYSADQRFGTGGGSRRNVCRAANRGVTSAEFSPAGLGPELVPCVEVLEVLPAVSHLAVLDLEDDAAGNVEVLAVSVRGAALSGCSPRRRILAR
jgi:integrase-like protein